MNSRNPPPALIRLPIAAAVGVAVGWLVRRVLPEAIGWLIAVLLAVAVLHRLNTQVYHRWPSRRASRESSNAD